MIGELTNSGDIPVLTRVLQFTAQRQRLLASNIANLTTPDYIPRDVSTSAFQGVLREAVECRRAAGGVSVPAGAGGGLNLRETAELKLDPSGQLVLRPTTPSGNILFQDRNNRDLERSMQALVENATAFRVASDLLRNRMDTIRAAISERA
jgi:flagellar basal-body rod protein FlgB